MKGYFAFSINKNRVKFVVSDIVLLLVSIILAYIIRYGIFLHKLHQLPLSKIIIYFLLFLPQVAIMFYITGLYERWGITTFTRSIIRIFISLVLIGLFNGLLFFFYHAMYIGRVVFILQLVIFFIFEGTFRFFVIMLMDSSRARRDLLLVNFTDEENEAFQKEPAITKCFNLVEFRYEQKEDLAFFLELLDKRTVVVISTHSKAIDRNVDMFLSLRFNEYIIYDMKTFYINVTGKIPFNTLGEVWSIFSENEFVMGIQSYYKIKRLLDIFFSLVALCLSLPLFLIIAVLVRFSSKGPVFFIQERLGWNKKPFNLIKFRSMKVNAEKLTGPVWASKNDPRITSIGRFLRKTRLDELPQLINVLKGDISFVGNRPIRRHFADILAEKVPFYDLRFIIKPGLTGWSQVKLNYVSTVEEQVDKFKYELFYIKKMSVMFDLIILIKTLKIIFGMKGS
jgi:exopolysaccharide biosynthesis polyprenyl glycosylphosphotransferase